MPRSAADRSPYQVGVGGDQCMFGINSGNLITEIKLTCSGPWAPRFRVASYELSDAEWTQEIVEGFTQVHN